MICSKWRWKRIVAVGFGWHGMPPPAFNDNGISLGQDGPDWSRNLATLTFVLGGHGACGWCGSSSSIRIPSLKFVGLAVWKIRRTLSVNINGPVTLTVDLETGMWVASKVGNLPSKFGHTRPLGSRIMRYVCDGRTYGRTKATLIAPFPTGRGIMNGTRVMVVVVSGSFLFSSSLFTDYYG